MPACAGSTANRRIPRKRDNRLIASSGTPIGPATLLGEYAVLQKKLRRRRHGINEMVLEIVSLMEKEIEQNQVSLATRLSNDVPRVFADRIQLQQVILNLIMNAVEALSAISDGSRYLFISTEKDKSDGVFLTVGDFGPGLDPEKLEQIFDAFYTTKREGMGMGLAVSRSIIEAHGGRLWATPNDPRGAVFQFTLPQVREETS
jgi:signal transduction histidine kinase